MPDCWKIVRGCRNKGIVYLMLAQLIFESKSEHGDAVLLFFAPRRVGGAEVPAATLAYEWIPGVNTFIG